MEWKNPDGSLTGGVVIEDGAGNKLGTSANPLNVTGGSGGGGGSNASVGLIGSSAPADATAIAFQNAAGNLVAPTPSAGLPIADSGGAATGVSQPAGGSGLSGWLSGIYSKLTGTLSVSWSGQSVSVSSLPAIPVGSNAIGSVSVSNLPSTQTVAGSVAVSNLPVTQAISATSLPLPSGAAADGTDATGVSQLGGGVGIRGWLSGIYAKLGGTLSVSWTGQSVSISSYPSLPAGSNSIGTVGVSSIPDASYGAGSTVSSIGAFNGGLGSLSTAGFGKLVVTCTAAGSATITWRGSNDGGTTWEPILASRIDSSAAAPVTAYVNPTAGSIWEIPCTHALLQVYCSAYTSSPTLSWCLKGPGAFLHTIVDQGAANASAWSVQSKPSTTGGIPTATVIIGAATTNAGLIKTSAGQVYAIDLSNNAATWAYFRLYNLAVAPTVGTSTVAAEYGVAPGASRTISFSDLGYPLATGIAYSITGGAPLNDATALAAASTVIATVHSD